ncbi:transcriptional regulator [Ligilactobacillus sp. LYQ135]
MKIDIKGYLDHQNLTIYRVAKISGYGYTTLHKSFNKEQSKATSINLRDLDALAQAQHKAMWEVLKELEEDYLMNDKDDDE